MSYLIGLRSLSNENNITLIINYINSMQTELNLSFNYRRDVLKLLSQFSKYNNDINFKDITRTNIIAFLESFRKTETQDSMHKWIGSFGSQC